MIRYRRLCSVSLLALCIAGLMPLGEGCSLIHVLSTKQDVLSSNWVVSPAPVSREVESSNTESSDHVEYLLSQEPVIHVDQQILTLGVWKQVTRTRTTTRTIAETFRHDLHQRAQTTTKYMESIGGGAALGGFLIGPATGTLVALGLQESGEGSAGGYAAVIFGSMGVGALIGLGIEAAANTKKKTEETEGVVDTKLVTKRSSDSSTQEDVVNRDLVDSVDVGVESDFFSEGSMVLRPSSGVITIPFELGYPFVLADGELDAARRVNKHLTSAGCRSASASLALAHLQTVILPLRVWTMSGNAAANQDAEVTYKVRVFKATQGVEAAAGCR